MHLMAQPREEQEKHSARIGERIVVVDKRVTELAKEMNRRFEEVNRRISEGREETNRRFDELSAEMKASKEEMISLRIAFQRSNYMQLAAMLGVIAAILAKGG